LACPGSTEFLIHQSIDRSSLILSIDWHNTRGGKSAIFKYYEFVHKSIFEFEWEGIHTTYTT
jgi:hypothetical protein